ncbi:MAG: ATP synthase F1 subunit gamma [Bacteroidetes bacterium]|nr:ATP synthase F1 subunit gamma [Bacteroidota bacterium]
MAANLKEVRERITSVKNTQQITKAMKVVSAAKLRKAQQAIVQMRPYSNKLNEMLTNILSNLEGGAETSFGTKREVENACAVVVTSDRGLCGAFNTNIIKSAIRNIEENYKEARANGKLTILCIGKRGRDYFKKHFKDCKLIEDYTELFHDLSFNNVSEVAQFLMDAFESKNYDSIHVSYGRFKNAAVQFPETEQFLPVVKVEGEKEEEEDKDNHRADYIFEPNKEGLLEYLIPSILQTSFQKFLLDTHASEHGARMTAMDKATENANELLRELRISYNKARQEAITSEISEIVGGAAALGG